MAEIIRVLKWRLDLDAAGLTEGLERATTKAREFGDEAERSGTRGSAGLGRTGEGAKKAGEGLDLTSIAAKNLDAVLGRLEKGTASPLVLQRNAELAAAGLKVLEAEALATGKALDTAFSGRVAAAIEAATGHAKAMNAELEQMGGQTPTKLDKVIGALDQVAQAEGAAADRAKALNDALARLEAAEGPKAIVSAAAKASVALETMEAEAKQAGGALKAFGAETAAAMSTAQAKIDSAAARAGRLADTAGDLRTKGELAAKGFESLAASAGSLEGMLGRLKDTGTATQQKFADTGFQAIALWAAFEKGLSIGGELDDELKKLGVDLSDIVGAGFKSAELAARAFGTSFGDTRPQVEGTRETVGKFRDIVRFLPGPMGDAERAARSLGLETKNYGDLLAPLPTKINPVLAALHAHGNAADAAQAALKALGVSWNDVGKDTATAREAIGQMDKNLTETARSGENLDEAVKHNAASIRELAERAAELGIPMGELPPAFQQAADAALRMKAADDAAAEAKRKLAEETKKATEAAQQEANLRDTFGPTGQAEHERLDPGAKEWQEKVRQELEATTQKYLEQVDAITATRKAELDLANAVANQVNSFNESNIALKAHMDQLQAVQEAQANLNQAWRDGLVTLQAVNWEIRHASEKTVELTDAQLNLIESLATISDKFGVASTWIGHFIAQLEDDMKKGNVSLEDFRMKVETIIRALTQLNGAGHGWMGNLQEELLQITILLNEFESSTRRAAGGAV